MAYYLFGFLTPGIVRLSLSVKHHFCSQSYGLRLEAVGLFPGLKKYPPDTFLPALCPGRPLQVPFASSTKEKKHPFGCLFSLVGEAGLEPARPQ